MSYQFKKSQSLPYFKASYDKIYFLLQCSYFLISGEDLCFVAGLAICIYKNGSIFYLYATQHVYI